MDNKFFEEMLRIVAVDDLMNLLVIRANLRLVFAELQTAAHATNNPLFVTYMDQVKKTGDRINAAIQDWFDRQALQFGADDSPIEGGESIS